MIGNNVVPDTIVNNRVHKGIDKAITHLRTPTIEADDVPRGAYMHLGGGLWLKRCRSCDDYMLSYGTVGYWLPFAEHEYAHGLDVVGYNVAMLA